MRGCAVIVRVDGRVTRLVALDGSRGCRPEYISALLQFFRGDWLWRAVMRGLPLLEEAGFEFAGLTH